MTSVHCYALQSCALVLQLAVAVHGLHLRHAPPPHHVMFSAPLSHCICVHCALHPAKGVTFTTLCSLVLSRTVFAGRAPCLAPRALSVPATMTAPTDDLFLPPCSAASGIEGCEEQVYLWLAVTQYSVMAAVKLEAFLVYSARQIEVPQMGVFHHAWG